MLGLIMGLIMADLVVTAGVCVVITKSINKVNKDIDLKKVEIKEHFSKEMWDLSFRKKPNILILKEDK